MSYKYDLFISHASEDKDFVRPLAEALRAQRLAVWFDEFELKPGRGVTRNKIDKRSVIISLWSCCIQSDVLWQVLATLGTRRSCPTHPLPGRSLQLSPYGTKLDILTWHLFSPSLANIISILSHEDPDRAATEVLRVLRPRPTAVEVAGVTSLSSLVFRRRFSPMTGGLTRLLGPLLPLARAPFRRLAHGGGGAFLCPRKGTPLKRKGNELRGPSSGTAPGN